MTISLCPKFVVLSFMHSTDVMGFQNLKAGIVTFTTRFAVVYRSKG